MSRKAEPAPSEPTEPAEPVEVEPNFAAFALRVEPLARRILRFYRIPPQDGDDLWQDVLLVAFQSWRRLRVPEAWVLTVLRRRCLQYWLEERSDRLQAVDLDFLEALAPAVAPAQEHLERLWDLERLASGLEPRHRALLVLRYRDGRSSDECADLLGYSRGSVRKLCSRVLARLLRRLDETPAACHAINDTETVG